MNHRRADWHRASMDVVTGLYDAKLRGDGPALFQRLVDLVLRHAAVDGVALLQLEHRGALRCLAKAPATCPDHTLDARWLDVLLATDRIHVDTPGTDAHGRIVLPIAHGRFRGALVVWAAVPRPHDSGFSGFLAHLRQEATEVVRTAHLTQDLGDATARFAALVGIIPHAVAFIDAGGARAWVNHAGARLLGVRPDQDDAATVLAALRRLRSTATDAEALEAVCDRLYCSLDERLSDWDWVYGEPVTRVLRVASLPLASAGLHGRLWVFDDVTESRLAAGQLQLLNTELAQKRAEADANSRAKSEFLAHMSHEIRTPMHGVLGLTQLLAREPLTDDQHDIVRRIRSAGDSLLAILNDLLDFSTLESGRMSVEVRPFDLASVLAGIDAVVSPAAGEKGLAWRCAAPPDGLGPLAGDAARLEQVLVNLAVNAVKFTPHGEVELTARAVRVERDRVRLRFDVRDTGIGIAPDVAAGLFDAFTQADTGISRRFGGIGLGLAICSRLAGLMGGEIGVDSEPGAGSTFWFEVPLARVAPAADVPRTPARSPRLSGMRVLVVDDSAMNRNLLERALSVEGAHPALASDGAEAIAILHSDPGAFDAVLMDVHMPVMDGLTAMRLIRSELGLRDLPLIAVSAAAHGEQQEAARVAGADEVLLKPVDLDALVGHLRLRIGTVRLATAAAAAPDAGDGVVDDAGAFPDIAGIDRARAAHSTGHDRAFFLMLLERFIADATGVGAATRDDLARDDRDTAARRVHSVKGNAGNLGALEVMRAAAALEDAIRAGRTEMSDGLSALDGLIGDVAEASRPWLASPPAAPRSADAPEVPPPSAEEVRTLRDHLQRHNLDALDLFEVMQAGLGAVAGPEPAARLSKAIADLRFDDARDLLDAMLPPATAGAHARE